MALGKLPVPRRPTNLERIAGQEPIALVVRMVFVWMVGWLVDLGLTAL